MIWCKEQTEHDHGTGVGSSRAETGRTSTEVSSFESPSQAHDTTQRPKSANPGDLVPQGGRPKQPMEQPNRRISQEISAPRSACISSMTRRGHRKDTRCDSNGVAMAVQSRLGCCYCLLPRWAQKRRSDWQGGVSFICWTISSWKDQIVSPCSFISFFSRREKE